MDILNYVEIAAALAGVAVSALLCAFPRFGITSWMLALMLMPVATTSAIQGISGLLQWDRHDVVFLSFTSLIFCAAGSCVASYTFERADFRTDLKKNRWFFIVVSAAAPILIIGMWMLRPAASDTTVELVALGPVGYGSAGYLLLVSVVTLANVEQTLRSAEEHIRWEIKFLLLGSAAISAAIIYVASQVLLYPAEYAYLSWQALRVFPVILLCACLLIVLSWRRRTGRDRVVVSHGIVYSTITLFSVGVYLIATSLVARWFSGWARPDFPLEPIIFLVSAIVLSAIVLGTGFRHRLHKWIRRNIFAGNYDYRRFWMDATEKVRSIDSPAATASALAQLIHDALGALDISIWLRPRDAEMMNLALARGTIFGSISKPTLRITDGIRNLTEPVAVTELTAEMAKTWPSDFFSVTKASFIVPLISSGRLVGLFTVGRDSSRRSLDRETREFLRVLAVHAASEFHKSELLETLVESREAEAFKTFSTFLLHDLKNFTSTLTLIAKNAVRHYENPDFQLDAFRSILDTAEKMKRLCNGLRTFSTTLAANKRLENLNDIVHEVVRGLDPNFSNRLKLNLCSLPMTEVDRQDFSRVLQNVLINANEAAPEGVVELSTYLESGRIVVTVVDNGAGIPEDFLQNSLFQPFHTTKGDGLGIGLFQSKRIIEAHDGTISVESKEGCGTVVRITMPMPKSEETLAKRLTPGVEVSDFAPEKTLHATAKS